MSQSLHPMLNIAIKAARAAGAIINRGSQDLDLLKVTHKGPNDFVSEVDQAAEAAIIDTLLTAYPAHGILAEESGRTHGARHSEFVWIIDPLDGTTNFLHGFPVYAVSIALAHRGIVQQAVVYDPTRNDLFFASRGRGAFLNDRRLRVSKRTRLADALIGTGFPFRKGDSFQRYVKMFESVMQSCAGVRRPGAAALDLCYVAAGWYDGFFETGLNPWDMAAGSLIITEAGGLVGNFTGEADFLYQRELVAGNPKVYGQLVTLLAPYSRVVKADDAVADNPADAATAHSTVTPTQALAAAAEADSHADLHAQAPKQMSDAGASPSTSAPPRQRQPIRIRRPAEVDPAAADALPTVPAPQRRRDATEPAPTNARASKAPMLSSADRPNPGKAGPKGQPRTGAGGRRTGSADRSPPPPRRRNNDRG
jgi:myo-inositol-1(or 4)-monophosphatase